MSSEPLSTSQCSHFNAAGRRCRMTVAPTHDTLCAQHLQQHLAFQPDPGALAAELLDSTGNLNTPEPPPQLSEDELLVAAGADVQVDVA